MNNTLRIATASLSAVLLFSCSLEDSIQPVESPVSGTACSFQQQT